MSRIIAVSSVKARPHRNSERRPGRFGAGILRGYIGQYDGRKAYTAAEVRWAEAVFNQAWDEDEAYDVRAREAAEIDRLCRGHCL